MSYCYRDNAFVLKAFADETRLKIIDMLSCGELCACKILKSFNITQPTLSYHMKILTDCGVVTGRRDGAWMHYRLNTENIGELLSFLSKLTTPKDDCICNVCKAENAVVLTSGSPASREARWGGDKCENVVLNEGEVKA